jgi:cysteine synthase A
MKIANSVRDLIGNTPLVKIGFISQKCEIIGKCEFQNPLGSIKDRVALNIIEEALKRGEIDKNSTLIEATSGNTGVGLAGVCASFGIKLIIVMPESMSLERRALMTHFGAELFLTPANLGMSGAIQKANELKEEIENSFLTSQFSNSDNPEAHFKNTAEEIWRDCNGKIDIFIAGVGTGGTISGVGKFLKEKNKNIKVIAVEPLQSAVLSGEKSSPHKIQGIGAGFIPKNFNREFVDEVLKVDGERAIEIAREVAKKEGLLVGISSGANLLASKIVSERVENFGKTIVTALNDTGERYISTELFFNKS